MVGWRKRAPETRPREPHTGAVRWSAGTIAAIVFLVPAVFMLLPACILLALTMLPTAVALFAGRDRANWLVLTIGAPNLCGALVPFLEFWERGRGFDAASEAVADPFNWLAALGGAALGWMIYLAMPAIILRIMAAKQRLRVAQLRASQAALIEEWGSEVADARDADDPA